MIRKTLDTDIPAVMAIYDAARAFMRAHGNATQWPEGTPSAEQLAADIAADGTVHGIAAAMFAFAKERADHLRIDTHQDNLPMQGASIKAGFERAGVVCVSDGTPRVAFDWLRVA